MTAAAATTIQIELWALITFLAGLLIAFLGAAFTFAKLLLAQVEKSLDERFKAQDKAREDGSALMRNTLERHLEQEKQFQTQLAALERDFLTWRGDLPLNYVRREDHIRMQTVIEAKLDGLALKIENQQLRGAQQ